MTKLHKKIASTAAIAAMFLNIAAPAFAGTTTLEITGNGSDSESTIDLDRTTATTVTQTNAAQVTNNVNTDAKTGGNDANDNTGGNVEIDTGDASVGVSVENMLNSNSADIGCDCDGGDTEVKIDGNGSDTDNKVDLDQSSVKALFQTNVADVDNNIEADAKTGHNDANDNTGGDVDVDTGDASVAIGVKTEANTNAASFGGGHGDGGTLSAWITGNGTESENLIELGLAHATVLSQANAADVDNNVEADAKTGKNDAEDNTGGNVEIDTGDADTIVGIDNMINFNVADVDCNCLVEDIMAKIAENGSDSNNVLTAEIGDALDLFQDNAGDIDNNVDADAKTGHNDADDNTGPSDGDPSIDSGDANSTTLIENEGNVNSIGTGSDFDFGGTGIDVDFDLSLNLGGLLSLLGLL